MTLSDALSDLITRDADVHSARSILLDALRRGESEGLYLAQVKEAEQKREDAMLRVVGIYRAQRGAAGVVHE